MAAKMAGLAVSRVEVDGTKIIVLTDAAGATGSQSAAVDLDRELAAFEARHGQN
jgi:hypothetical protein